ncbi:hypothetical protein ABKN59_002889 [Abortiporus biennis]
MSSLLATPRSEPICHCRWVFPQHVRSFKSEPVSWSLSPTFASQIPTFYATHVATVSTNDKPKPDSCHPRPKIYRDAQCSPNSPKPAEDTPMKPLKKTTVSTYLLPINAFVWTRRVFYDYLHLNDDRVAFSGSLRFDFLTIAILARGFSNTCNTSLNLVDWSASVIDILHLNIIL